MSDTQPTLAEPSAATTDFLQPSVPAAPAETAGQAGLEPAADRAPETAHEVQDLSCYDRVKWPEEVPFDPAQVTAFKALAQELHLSAQQVQKLVDFETKSFQTNLTREAEEKRETVAQWARQTKTLYGAGLEQELRFALRAADAFGGPDLRTLLEETGLGNHPVIIRTLSGIGKAISEDACPGGKPSAPQDKTFAEALYGKH